MRRALVLTNETARHPFRSAFVHTERLEREIIEANQGAVAESPPPARSRLREDVSFFVLSYVSGLVIFFGMIV
jgi:hypothetical protein